jgi:hypothetical protein
MISALYFVKTILFPTEHPTPLTQRNLTLTAKIIQNMANLTVFGAKEAFMVPCNDFLVSMRQRMVTYFDTISVRLLFQHLTHIHVTHPALVLCFQINQNAKLGPKAVVEAVDGARALAYIVRHCEANSKDLDALCTKSVCFLSFYFMS